MLENAVRICDAMGGGICRWDGDALHHVALKWAYPAFAEFLMRTPIHPNPKTSFGRMLATKTVVHVPDLAAQPAYAEQREPGIVTAVEVGHIRTALYVPMLKGSELIGAFTMGSEEVRPFTEKQIDLVSNFAAQAVIAIENARLLNDTQRALERQTATSEILKVIAASPSDTAPVFEAIAQSANRLLGGLSTAVWRFEDEIVHLAAFTPTNPDADAALRAASPLPIRELAVVALLSEGETAQIPDTEEGPSRLRDLAQLRGYRAMLFVPLMHQGSAVGFVSVTRKDPGAFDPDDVTLLKTFADQAVIAIQNARLFNETKEALEQQTATSEVLQVISSSPGDLEPVRLVDIGGGAVRQTGDDGAGGERVGIGGDRPFNQRTQNLISRAARGSTAIRGGALRSFLGKPF